MRTVSIMTPRRSATAICLLTALVVFVLTGCTTPTGSGVRADNKRKPFLDWFGTSKTESTAQAEARFDPTRPSPLAGPQNQVPISKEARDMMKRLNAELRRYNLPETQRDEVVRRLLRNQPKHVADALSKVR